MTEWFLMQLVLFFVSFFFVDKMRWVG